MSRTGVKDLCVSKIREAGGDGTHRFVDLRIDLVRQADGPTAPPATDSDVQLSVGGQWDRRFKRYVGESSTAIEIGLHRGQLEASDYLTSWFNERAAGKRLLLETGVAVESVGLVGGRRSGKTDLGTKFTASFAIMVPRSRVWFVSESIPKTEELAEQLIDTLPASWYSYLGAPWFKFSLVNGSTIHLRSAHDPEQLKRGRADFIMLNEAQNMSERAYIICRGAIADRGGLVLLAANPPDSPIGRWLGDYVDQARAGRRPAKVFTINPEQNPWIEYSVLTSLKSEVDERTYQQEVLGMFLPDEDRVWHAWSTIENEQPLPQTPDCTEEFCKKFFGKPYPFFAGADFQIHPHMPAVIMQAYPNPFLKGDYLLWYAQEIVVEGGDEDDLLDAVGGFGYGPKDIFWIGDASGKWQESKREVKGRGSFDVFARRGWTIVPPDPNQQRNPDILERVRVGNARFKDADGGRHVFSSPENYLLNRALKLWENRDGVPYRRSEFAHLSDAASYPLYRCYPRRAVGPVHYKKVQRERSERAHDLKGF